MMKLKRLSSIHTEANGAVIGGPLGTWADQCRLVRTKVEKNLKYAIEG